MCASINQSIYSPQYTLLTWYHELGFLPCSFRCHSAPIRLRPNPVRRRSAAASTMVGTPPSSPRAPDATADAQKEREAALARAEAAEQEAAAAAQERDAAAQRARDALARAARERALAAKGAPDADHDAEKEEDAASVDSGGTALHHAILAHEAAALVNLHA